MCFSLQKTKKLVEIPSTREVQEEYTEIVHQPAVRNKEVWVRKIVQEKYMKPVPVKKCRTVSVPTTVLQEIEDFEIVDVTENKAVEVDGYRVDTVEDSRVVEVEEYQTFDLQPKPTGRTQVINTRDLGAVNGLHHSRRIGTEIYHPQDERHKRIEEDTVRGSMQTFRRTISSHSHNYHPQQHGCGPNGSLCGKQCCQNNSALTQFRPVSVRQQQGQQAFAQSQSYATSTQQFSNSAAHQSNNNLSDDGFLSRVGFKVRNGDASNGVGNGVLVYRVVQGESASRAGLLSGDVIMYCQNKPTRNIAEFRAVVNNVSNSLVQLQLIV